MDQKLAVLFMPDDMTLTKEQAPLMLRPILFCPILTWMVEELMGRGIERFFIVSDKRAHDMMRPYVPENADVVYVDGARHGEELLTLLKDEKGSVLIVNGAVLPVGVFSGGAVYSADAKECCKVLKEHGAFAAFPKGAEITKGFLPVGDDEELRSAQDMCRRKIADKHFAAGVSIMDPNNTYIDPRVKIGSGTARAAGVRGMDSKVPAKFFVERIFAGYFAKSGYFLRLGANFADIFVPRRLRKCVVERKLYSSAIGKRRYEGNRPQASAARTLYEHSRVPRLNWESRHFAPERRNRPALVESPKI